MCIPHIMYLEATTVQILKRSVLISKISLIRKMLHGGIELGVATDRFFADRAPFLRSLRYDLMTYVLHMLL